MFSLGSRCVGISALNRLGFNGVTTMKMISTTNSTSINGVTLMYGTARLRPPALVAINLPSVQRLASVRSEEHTSELQSRLHLVCRLLLEKKKKKKNTIIVYIKKYITNITNMLKLMHNIK